MEGVVAKLANGLYTPNETTCVKIKNVRYSQAEGGMTFSIGERRGRSGS
jgi:hypothetical protein